MLIKVEYGHGFHGHPGMKCDWRTSKQQLRKKKNIKSIGRQKRFKKSAIRKGLKKSCPKEILLGEAQGY